MLPRTPLHRPQMDQRYWRHRANRALRKARVTRTLLRWSAAALANLVVAGLVLYAGTRIFQRITTTREFAVERIDVEGTERASADAIRERLRPYLGRNLLDLNLHEVAADCAGDPWVAQASAKRILPSTLRVEVVERQPVAIARLGGAAHIVDVEGQIVGPAGADLGDLPVLGGLDGYRGQELAGALRRGAQVARRLNERAAEWLKELSEVDLSEGDRVTLRTVDPGPRILLDPLRVERNLGQYLTLRAEIAQRAGPLHYVDLRWQDRISVLPASSNP